MTAVEIAANLAVAITLIRFTRQQVTLQRQTEDREAKAEEHAAAAAREAAAAEADRQLNTSIAIVLGEHARLHHMVGNIRRREPNELFVRSLLRPDTLRPLDPGLLMHHLGQLSREAGLLGATAIGLLQSAADDLQSAIAEFDEHVSKLPYERYWVRDAAWGNRGDLATERLNLALRMAADAVDMLGRTVALHPRGEEARPISLPEDLKATALGAALHEEIDSLQRNRVRVDTSG